MDTNDTMKQGLPHLPNEIVLLFVEAFLDDFEAGQSVSPVAWAFRGSLKTPMVFTLRELRTRGLSPYRNTAVHRNFLLHNMSRVNHQVRDMILKRFPRVPAELGRSIYDYRIRKDDFCKQNKLHWVHVCLASDIFQLAYLENLWVVPGEPRYDDCTALMLASRPQMNASMLAHIQNLRLSLSSFNIGTELHNFQNLPNLKTIVLSSKRDIALIETKEKYADGLIPFNIGLYPSLGFLGTSCSIWEPFWKRGIRIFVHDQNETWSTCSEYFAEVVQFDNGVRMKLLIPGNK
ncbi:hypothetical protein CkaCkLH20_08949 [Colletotrichum karsti]|uniref:Uncharacterized protein n=1 Tax=Colletotrichum karsti TaxID=1095194 RepID=A0A9P6I7L6_9PEZI|nr:uncharacterized protein CkaCkLH20_08949 [Colletotrichum karsti]KAF9873490.1 hypothetical protein CkaCkLH20_08949 [Colletotrichum karsti]